MQNCCKLNLEKLLQLHLGPQAMNSLQCLKVQSCSHWCVRMWTSQVFPKPLAVCRCVWAENRSILFYSLCFSVCGATRADLVSVAPLYVSLSIFSCLLGGGNTDEASTWTQTPDSFLHFLSVDVVCFFIFLSSHFHLHFSLHDLLWRQWDSLTTTHLLCDFISAWVWRGEVSGGHAVQTGWWHVSSHAPFSSGW